MMRQLLVFLILGLSLNAYACKPPYIEYESFFEAGSGSLSSEEIRRMLDWRGKTRQAFPAGFEVLIEVWENPNAGIPPSLVSRRVAFLRGLLENLGVARQDIGPEDVYQSREKILVMEHERFLNTASLILKPRCPHLCCDQGDLR